MKVQVMGVVLFVLSIILAGLAFGQAEVVVAPVQNGTGATLAVDLLGAGKWKALSNARWYRKVDVAAAEYVVKPIARNPGKTLLAAAGTLVAVRAADGKLDDDLKGLWESLGLRDEGKPRREPEIAPEPVEGLGIATFGNDSPVYIETYADNISVETHGDNSPIVIKEPPPLEIEE